jgi:hypothetical protein
MKAGSDVRGEALGFLSKVVKIERLEKRTL